MLATLNATFNPGDSGKLDINTATQGELLAGLRDPLTKAGAACHDDQLAGLVSRIFTYRDTPPRSGLIRNLDESIERSGRYAGGPWRPSRALRSRVICIRRVEIVGPKIGADLRQQAINVVLIALGGDARLYCVPL